MRDMDAAQEMVDEAAQKTGHMIMLLAGERKGNSERFLQGLELYTTWNMTILFYPTHNATK